MAVHTFGVERSLTMAIDTDAHRVDQRRYMRYGIDQARRGWLEKRHGANTLPWAEFRRWLPAAALISSKRLATWRRGRR